MAAPQTLDVLSRYLADAFDEHLVINEPTAFQTFFGRSETMSFTHFSPNANDLDIEITRANEKLAALVPRGTLGKFIGTTHLTGTLGQSTFFSRKYPLTEEEIPLTAEMINNRLIPGEGAYEGLPREVRLRRYAERAYQELIRREIRLQEYLAMQSITLGKQSAQAVGTPGANDYDWRRSSSNTVTPTHGWGNALGVPLIDLDSICLQLRGQGHVNPDMAIFGATTLNYFLANATIQGTTTSGYASHLYWDFVQFNMNFKPDAKFDKFVKGGLVPVGKLRTPGGFELTIFVYPQGYTAANGTFTKYLGDTLALVMSSGARADRYFGPPERLPLTASDQQRLMERFGFNPMLPPIPRNDWAADGVIVPQMFYVDAYEDDKSKVETVRIQSAPVFVTVQTDAFATLTVGTTS
jgi:hypothetical protein